MKLIIDWEELTPAWVSKGINRIHVTSIIQFFSILRDYNIRQRCLKRISKIEDVLGFCTINIRIVKNDTTTGHIKVGVR